MLFWRASRISAGLIRHGRRDDRTRTSAISLAPFRRREAQTRRRSTAAVANSGGRTATLIERQCTRRSAWSSAGRLRPPPRPAARCSYAVNMPARCDSRCSDEREPLGARRAARRLPITSSSASRTSLRARCLERASCSRSSATRAGATRRDGLNRLVDRPIASRTDVRQIPATSPPQVCRLVPKSSAALARHPGGATRRTLLADRAYSPCGGRFHE